MSNYVIKVFEKQDNSELTPFISEETGKQMSVEGTGFMIFGLTPKKDEQGLLAGLHIHVVKHAISNQMIAEALHHDKDIMQAMKHHAVMMLIGGMLGVKPDDDSEEDEESAAE